MNRRHPPRLATWLLEWSGVSEALIGDLAESYLERRSTGWYWREALIAASLSLRTRIGADKPRLIRLAATGAAIVCFFTYALVGSQRSDLAGAVAIEALSSGWMTAAATDGRPKLVPALSFTVRNHSNQPLEHLYLNAVFHRIHERYAWGNRFRGPMMSRELPPGATSETVLLASPVGYTSGERQPDFLAHSQFVDATVTLFARHGGGAWTQLGEFPIARRPFDR